jgi:hypothetical protein
MTVRTTGGSPAPPRRRADPFGPPLQPALDPTGADVDPDIATVPETGLPAVATPDATPAEAEGHDPAEVHRETRKEVRDARRRRRHLMVACAAVVVVCLALTILIVSMARQRPIGLPAPAPTSSVAAIANLSVSDVSPSHGAVAPPGGHH